MPPPEDNPADDQPIDQTAYEAFMAEVAKQDSCPRCLGELDEGWECTKCGYDARPLIRKDGSNG